MAVITTGNNTPTAGGITYGDGSTYAVTAAGTSGQPVVSGGAGAPVFRPYTLPATDGSANQLLQTNGSGVLSFATVSAGFTLGTPVVTTSSTSINFTGIPAGIKIINIMFSGISTNGTSALIVQIGDSGGIETTGYAGSCAEISGASFTGSSTNGFYLTPDSAAARVFRGYIQLVLENSSTYTWMARSSLAQGSSSGVVLLGSGAKSLSAELDRVRLTTDNGTDTFDLGEINISYM